MKNQNKKSKVGIRYDQATVTYTSQFLACPSDEELLLEFSSGMIKSNGTDVLPINTRLALPWSAAERLSKILNEVVAQQARRKTQHVHQPNVPTPTIPSIPQATLPSMPQS